jgi:hypothetical protein
LVLSTRLFFACLAALATALGASTAGLAAPALQQSEPQEYTCTLRSYSLAELNALQLKNAESCPVSPAANLSALNGMRGSGPRLSEIDPSSIGFAALESLRLRSALGSSTLVSGDEPASISFAALESLRLRSALGSSTLGSSDEPSSISFAALESLRWQIASSSSTFSTAQAANTRLSQVQGRR